MLSRRDARGIALVELGDGAAPAFQLGDLRLLLAAAGVEPNGLGHQNDEPLGAEPPAAGLLGVDVASEGEASAVELHRLVPFDLNELRLREGCPLSLLREEGLAAAGRALSDGLLDPGPYEEGRAVLTLRGRLLADAVVRDLVD